MAADALGNPLRFLLTPGQHADVRYAEALVEGMGAGAVIADRGYDSAGLVAHIEATGAEAVIPSRRTNRHQRSYDANLYADRNKVERLIGRLKQHRRVARATTRRRRVISASCTWRLRSPCSTDCQHALGRVDNHRSRTSVAARNTMLR